MSTVELESEVLPGMPQSQTRISEIQIGQRFVFTDSHAAREKGVFTRIAAPTVAGGWWYTNGKRNFLAAGNRTVQRAE